MSRQPIIESRQPVIQDVLDDHTGRPCQTHVAEFVQGGAPPIMVAIPLKGLLLPYLAHPTPILSINAIKTSRISRRSLMTLTGPQVAELYEHEHLSGEGWSIRLSVGAPFPAGACFFGTLTEEAQACMAPLSLHDKAQKAFLLLENMFNGLGNVDLVYGGEGLLEDVLTRDWWVKSLVLSAGSPEDVEVVEIQLGEVTLPLAGAPLTGFLCSSPSSLPGGPYLLRAGETVRVRLRYKGGSRTSVQGGAICDELHPGWRVTEDRQDVQRAS